MTLVRSQAEVRVAPRRRKKVDRLWTERFDVSPSVIPTRLNLAFSCQLPSPTSGVTLDYKTGQIETLRVIHESPSIVENRINIASQALTRPKL